MAPAMAALPVLLRRLVMRPSMGSRTRSGKEFAQSIPQLFLLGEPHRGMRGTGRGERDECETRMGELRHAEAGGSLAVEADRAQFGERGDEIGQRVGLGLADRGVEAAVAAGRGNGVPQPDFGGEQGLEAGLVVERIQLFLDYPPDEVPEAVLRVRVVSPRFERFLSG